MELPTTFGTEIPNCRRKNHRLGRVGEGSPAGSGVAARYPKAHRRRLPHAEFRCKNSTTACRTKVLRHCRRATASRITWSSAGRGSRVVTMESALAIPCNRRVRNSYKRTSWSGGNVSSSRWKSCSLNVTGTCVLRYDFGSSWYRSLDRSRPFPSLTLRFGK